MCKLLFIILISATIATGAILPSDKIRIKLSESFEVYLKPNQDIGQLNHCTVMFRGLLIINININISN